MKRALHGCLIDAIREFLIKPDKFVLKMADNDNNVLACTDMSCLSQSRRFGTCC
jgi:hypothetical protein